MVIPENSKQEIIQGLLKMLQDARILETSLKLKGNKEDGDKTRQEADKLSDEIDTLQKQVLDEWLGQKDVVIEGITKASTSLEKSVEQIKNGVETAKNIVKVIGFIDDAVVIAAKLAKKAII